MIVKRNEHNDEEVVELENGCRFHYLYNLDSLDNMKEQLSGPQRFYSSGWTATLF